ncbi:MAG: hypothetical protein M0D55_17820 [Elusimicrobiota bacterium]|nr:MAG: hypothetical protein M0D55_17820 [Elusimicrobiota bacterium]
MKLQNKFLALLAPAGFVAGGLILYLIKRAANEVIVGGAERAAATIARAAALEAGRPMARGREADLLPVVQTFQRREGALYAAALGPDGRVLAHTTVTEKGRVESDERTAEALKSDEPRTWTGEERGEPVIFVVAPVRAPGAAEGADSFLLTGEQPLPAGSAWAR